MAVSHIKSNTIADFTGTVTVFDSVGATVTANATDLVRPSDWNSAHNQYLTISGNTLGSSTVSGTNIVLAGGNNVTLSANTAAGAATISFVGADLTPYQLTSNTSNITSNAFPSANTTKFAGTGTSITGGASITLNSNGIQFNGVDLVGSGAAITGNALMTANSQGISFNGSGLAGIGTSATNASITLNSNGLAISVAAPGGGAGYSAGVSNIGNTSGNTGTVSNQLVLAGGNNITLSQSTNAGGATVTISAPSLTSLAGTGTAITGGAAITLNSNGLSFNGTGLAGTATGFTGTNASGSMTVNSAGVSLRVSVAAAGGGAFSAGVSTGGNTAGTTGTVNNQVVFVGGNNITLSQSSAAGGATITISGGAGGGGAAVTLATYNNRQLGASSHTTHGQNSVWCAPMRLNDYLNASSALVMMTITGTVTSAVAATYGATINFGLYAQNATNSTQFDSTWSNQLTVNIWNSGTSSGSYALGTATASSAGQNILTQQVHGMRMFTVPVGSTLSPGLYMWVSHMSTSSAGYASLVRTFNAVIDNPLPVGMGTFGQATTQSIGYVDGGTLSVTSNGLPASIGFNDIRQTLNAMPYVKIGAL